MFRANILLILRRANYINTASGIVTLSKWPFSAQVEKELLSFSTCALKGHLLRVTIPDAVLIKFDLLRMRKILLETCICMFFFVSLTAHLNITLANDQLDAQIFNTFIKILYMYMFRAISCSSSGGQIILTQHLVSSLSVSDRSLHMLRKNWFLSQHVHWTVTYWEWRYQMLC